MWRNNADGRAGCCSSNQISEKSIRLQVFPLSLTFFCFSLHLQFLPVAWKLCSLRLSYRYFLKQSYSPNLQNEYYAAVSWYIFPSILDYAERVGISKEGASFLLSILGVTSTVRQITIYNVVRLLCKCYVNVFVFLLVEDWVHCRRSFDKPPQGASFCDWDWVSIILLATEKLSEFSGERTAD